MGTPNERTLNEVTGVPPLYDKHEAAAILRVKVSWLERRASERRIPFTLLGGAYRFTPDHLAEIIRLNEKGALTGETRSSTPPRRARQRRRPVVVPAQDDEFRPLRPKPRRAA